MLLTSIKLTGWRSFGREGIELNDLRPSNLLLGPNNVGKSNVIRFLKWFRDAIVLSELPTWPLSSWHSFTTIKAKCTEADFWLRDTSSPVVAELKFSWDHPDIAPMKKISRLPSESCTIRTVVTYTDGKAVLFSTPVLTDGTPLFSRRKDGSVSTLDGAGKRTPVDGTPNAVMREVRKDSINCVAMICLKALAENLIDVEALRHHRLETPGSNGSSTHGGALMTRLHQVAIDPQQRRKWTLARKRLEGWIQRLSGETHVQLEANPNEVALVVPRGTESLSCSLDDLGTGITEALIILEFIELSKSRDWMVCIEEPEAHLHSGAVNELVRILEEELDRPQLLITSHSTSLVDQARDHWRIFRLTNRPDGSTQVSGMETHQEQFDLLDDLGIRASQLFLADATIWVEGPSDMVYLAELLRLYAPKLVPGRHYAFVPYGGASGSHLTFDEEDSEKLAKLLHVSRHVVVVGDRDTNKPNLLPKNLKRLADEALTAPGGNVVATPGREIENLVDAAVLRAAVAAEGPNYLRVDGHNRNLSYGAINIPKGDSFDTTLARAASFIDPPGKLSRAEKKRLAQHISKRKVPIAHRVVESEAPFKPEAEEWAKALIAALTPARSS